MISFACVQRSMSAEKAVLELMKTGMIGQSPAIDAFENAFAQYMNVNNAVAVSSGTVADIIALLVLKHRNPGRNEVIMPALTFSAQLNAVLFAGLTPRFVDVREDMQMDWMEATKLVGGKTLCVFPVHLMGRACEIYPIDTYVVEDTCEALGTKWRGKRCGTFGNIATFSFFVSHTMTTGEGGMIVTNNDEMAALARKFRNHGKMQNDQFHFDVVGLNGKMTSLQAVIGHEALKLLDLRIAQRRNNYLVFGGSEKEYEYVVPHGFPILMDSEYDRDNAMEYAKSKGIDSRNLFSSLPTQEPAYDFLGHKLTDFPVAEDFGRRGLYLPCHQGLNEKELISLKEVIHALRKEKTTREEVKIA